MLCQAETSAVIKDMSVKQTLRQAEELTDRVLRVLCANVLQADRQIQFSVQRYTQSDRIPFPNNLQFITVIPVRSAYHHEKGETLKKFVFAQCD